MRIDLLLKFRASLYPSCRIFFFFNQFESITSYSIVIVNWVANSNRFSTLAELFNRFVPNQAHDSHDQHLSQMYDADMLGKMR